MNSWIPISNRLPPKKKMVLVACNNGKDIGIGSYSPDKFGDWNLYTGVGTITHWKTLPDIPNYHNTEL